MFDLRGHASTYISREATTKFWNIDRIMFAWSPYLTDPEAWKIVDELEKMANSKYDGNFSANDAFNWMAEQLGPARYQALCQMWTMDNQAAIIATNNPEELREAWVHKITLTEEDDFDVIKANPYDYVLVRTTRDSQEKNGIS